MRKVLFISLVFLMKFVTAQTIIPATITTNVTFTGTCIFNNVTINSGVTVTLENVEMKFSSNTSSIIVKDGAKLIVSSTSNYVYFLPDQNSGATKWAGIKLFGNSEIRCNPNDLNTYKLAICYADTAIAANCSYASKPIINLNRAYLANNNIAIKITDFSGTYPLSLSNCFIIGRENVTGRTNSFADNYCGVLVQNNSIDYAKYAGVNMPIVAIDSSNVISGFRYCINIKNTSLILNKYNEITNFFKTPFLTTLFRDSYGLYCNSTNLVNGATTVSNYFNLDIKEVTSFGIFDNFTHYKPSEDTIMFVDNGVYVNNYNSVNIFSNPNPYNYFLNFSSITNAVILLNCKNINIHRMTFNNNLSNDILIDIIPKNVSIKIDSTIFHKQSNLDIVGYTFDEDKKHINIKANKANSEPSSDNSMILIRKNLFGDNTAKCIYIENYYGKDSIVKNTFSQSQILNSYHPRHCITTVTNGNNSAKNANFKPQYIAYNYFIQTPELIIRDRIQSIIIDKRPNTKIFCNSFKYGIGVHVKDTATNVEIYNNNFDNNNIAMWMDGTKLLNKLINYTTVPIAPNNSFMNFNYSKWDYSTLSKLLVNNGADAITYHAYIPTLGIPSFPITYRNNITPNNLYEMRGNVNVQYLPVTLPVYNTYKLTPGSCYGNGYYSGISEPNVDNTLNSNRVSNVTLEDNKILLDGFSVFPNPANDKLTIKLSAEFDQNLNENSQVNIIDVLGNIVSSFNKSSIENGILNVDLSNFSSGIYFVNIANNGKMTTSKFIVRK